MDDEVLYLNFLVQTLHVQPERVVQEISIFTDTFRSLLTTSDEDLDEFVHPSEQFCSSQ